jgi:hypothetical protein
MIFRDNLSVCPHGFVLLRAEADLSFNEVIAYTESVAVLEARRP